MQLDVEQNFKKTMKTAYSMLLMLTREKLGRVYTFAKISRAIIGCVFPFISILLPGFIINELTGDRRISMLCLYVFILLIVPKLWQFLDIYIQRWFNDMSRELLVKYNEAFNIHICKIDYEFFEIPDCMHQRERAANTLNNQLMDTVDELCSLIASAINIITISTIISTINPVIMIILIVVIYLNSLVLKWRNGRYLLIDDEDRIVFKKGLGHRTAVKSQHYAKELRLFQAGEYFAKKVSENTREGNKCEHKTDIISGRAELMRMGTDIVQQIALYAYSIFMVLNQKKLVGDMTIFMNAAGQFSGALSNVSNVYVSLSKNSILIQEYMDFMDLPTKQYLSGTRTAVFKDNSVIEFVNVSFKYPGSERYVIQNMNLKIYANQKLCIVGENGSGKSTFIKLLTRLYFPTEGEILLDGINIYEYEYESYQKLFTPVFQDFCLYLTSFKENVILAQEYDENRMNDVCEKLSLAELISKLPKGYNTILDKYVDPHGVHLSGGEAQKMAIARACYHDGAVYILDEPTAALDPMMESEIYRDFSSLMNNHTAVLITHRLSAVQLADKVAVFSDGQVVEYGTHVELYIKGGVYTEMFDKQAQFYRSSTEESSYIKQ